MLQILSKLELLNSILYKQAHYSSFLIVNCLRKGIVVGAIDKKPAEYFQTSLLSKVLIRFLKIQGDP